MLCNSEGVTEPAVLSVILQFSKQRQPQLISRTWNFSRLCSLISSWLTTTTYITVRSDINIVLGVIYINRLWSISFSRTCNFLRTICDYDVNQFFQRFWYVVILEKQNHIWNSWTANWGTICNRIVLHLSLRHSWLSQLMDTYMYDDLPI